MCTFPAFLGIAFIVIVTPGPDTALTIRNTLLGGRSGGVFTALGVAGGQMIWALAAGIGVVAVLRTSEPLFLVVKFAGAAYLVYLGVHTLLAALRPTVPAQGVMPVKCPHHMRRLTAFRQGIISNLGNPKMAVFFASLFPQFAPSGEGRFSGLLLLGLAFAVMTFSWLALYAAFLARTGDVLRRPAVRRTVEGITGTLLIGLGLRLAAEQG